MSKPRYLKYELYKLSRDLWIWAVVAGLIIFCVIFTSTGGIFTSSQFASTYGDLSPDVAGSALGISGVEDTDDILALAMTRQFPNIFWHTANAMGFFMFIFGPYFICRDFSQRTMGTPIACGVSRTRIFWTKFGIYHAATLLSGVCMLLVLLSMYGGSWWNIESGYLLHCLGLYALIWTAAMSIALMLSFLLRSAIISGAALFLMYLILSPFGELHPVSIVACRELWEPDAAWALIQNAIIVSAVWIVLSTAVSFVSFSRAELK